MITKEPWKNEDAGNPLPKVYTIRDGSGYPIAYVEKHPEIGDGKNNMNAIVALPELLESAKYFDYAVGDYQGFDDLPDEEIITINVSVKAIRDNMAAIQKAKEG